MSPALQSFIADSYVDGARGTGVGFINLVGTVGGIGGGAIATVMAGHDFWGIPGWRFAFMVMAMLSCLIAFLVHAFVADPRRRTTADHDTGKALSRYKLLHPVSLWVPNMSNTSLSAPLFFLPSLQVHRKSFHAVIC